MFSQSYLGQSRAYEEQLKVDRQAMEPCMYCLGYYVTSLESKGSSCKAYFFLLRWRHCSHSIIKGQFKQDLFALTFNWFDDFVLRKSYFQFWSEDNGEIRLIIFYKSSVKVGRFPRKNLFLLYQTIQLTRLGWVWHLLKYGIGLGTKWTLAVP